MSRENPHYIFDIRRDNEKNEAGDWMYHIILFDGTEQILQGYMPLAGVVNIVDNPESMHRAYEVLSV
jgi:hypothetical protein